MYLQEIRFEPDVLREELRKKDIGTPPIARPGRCRITTAQEEFWTPSQYSSSVSVDDQWMMITLLLGQCVS